MHVHAQPLAHAHTLILHNHIHTHKHTLLIHNHTHTLIMHTHTHTHTLYLLKTQTYDKTSVWYFMAETGILIKNTWDCSDSKCSLEQRSIGTYSHVEEIQKTKTVIYHCNMLSLYIRIILTCRRNTKN